MQARLSLHWDGKMMADLSGDLYEMEAIIVCGENFPEGKLGLPTFPQLSDKTELRDLVTSESWELFDILKLSADWLALPPAEWDTDPDYIEFRKFVRSVKVTNDCAERGIKLATDYSKSLTKDSKERSKIYSGGGGEEGQARC